MFGLDRGRDPATGQLQGRLHPPLQRAGSQPVRHQGQRLRATIAAGTNGYTPTGVGAFQRLRRILLLPMLMFFNLWSNWGATLYGEVRGASDFRKNIYAMGGALVFTTIVAASSSCCSRRRSAGILQAWQQRVLRRDGPDRRRSRIRARSRRCSSGAAVLQFILITTCSRCGSSAGWGRCSCPRPAWCSPPRSTASCLSGRPDVSRDGVPYWALGLMLIPSIPISALYAYSRPSTTDRSTRRW